jgi:uncharacterized phage protein (TIGR02220 family)
MPPRKEKADNMNYIDEDTAFERWCENNYLPILSQAIWKKLFKRFNRSGWCEWITVDNLNLMADVQIRHEKTFIEYRDKLIESGLIQYIKGKKSSPNKYKFISYEIYTSKNEVQREVYPPVQKEVYPPVQPPVNSTDINKLNKTKQNNKKENTEKKSEIDNQISEIIDYLNLKANKRHDRNVSKNRELISGRLNEGKTVEDCKYVIDVKCEEWLSNAEFNKNLNPVTLFRPSNFDRYLNQQLRNPQPAKEPSKTYYG